MKFIYIVQQFFFIFRFRWCAKFELSIRYIYYRFGGMKVGKSTHIPKIHITWPHQVAIGNHCILEHDIYFHFDGIWKKGPSIIIGDHCFVGFGCEFNINNKITIGDNCLIASGCKFIDHNHGSKKD